MFFNDYYNFRIQGHSFDSVCWLKIPTLKTSPAISNLVGVGVKVIVTELPDNPGMSICNAHEILRAKICQEFDIAANDLVYLEHWPAWSAEEGGYERNDENYHLVQLTEGKYPSWANLSPNDEQAVKAYLHISKEISTLASAR